MEPVASSPDERRIQDEGSLTHSVRRVIPTPRLAGRRAASNRSLRSPPHKAHRQTCVQAAAYLTLAVVSVPGLPGSTSTLVPTVTRP